jgi:hypothetical protein
VGLNIFLKVGVAYSAETATKARPATTKQKANLTFTTPSETLRQAPYFVPINDIRTSQGKQDRY